MLSKSSRLVTYSLSVDMPMTTSCLLPFSIMIFFRLGLRFQTKCIGAKIKTYLMLLFRLITTSYSLEIIRHEHLIFVCWWEVHQTSEDSANVLSFLPWRKEIEGGHLVVHSWILHHALLHLILLIRSCKLETVLICLILGGAMGANEAIFCLLRL